MSMKPSVNWLLAMIPVTLAVEHAGAPAPWVFLCAALAIIPIASLIVRSTEHLATYTGDAVGGLLNATFGNAPELIIAMVALRAGLLDMVRASLAGAILANLLLALGVAFLLGGAALPHPDLQRGRRARLQHDDVHRGDQPDGAERVQPVLRRGGGARRVAVLNVSLAIVLLVAYALYLVFMLKTHPDEFKVDKGAATRRTRARAGASGARSAAWSSPRCSRRG